MPDRFMLESEKYRVLRELGRGGMGVVYLAEDLVLKRTVALKVLHEHLNRDTSFVARFQREARSVSSLRHPNIVFIHGLESENEINFIDMEYVDGLSLDRVARSGVLARPVVARIARDILEGLVACHGTGVIHRDIKPANILIGQDGVAKIVDFGLATAYAGHLLDSVKNGTASGVFLGTPRYAPPAAWDGLTPVPEWDLYSLGVILFELLSGEIAFPGDTPMAIMRQHLKAPLPPLNEAAPEISRELAALVDGLIASEGREPAASAAEVLRALRETPEFTAFHDGDTASTIEVAIRKERTPHRAAKARPWLLRGLYTAAALLLIAAAAWWLPARDPESSHAVAPPVLATEPTGSTHTFLRPAVVGVPEEDSAIWMFSRETADGPARIVALDDTGLRHLMLEPGAGVGLFTVRGHWGESVTPAKGSIRYGTLEGSAALDTRGHLLSLTLYQINTRDATRVPLHLMARPLDTPKDESEFIRILESNPAAQHLLYNELLPRNLAWARELEAMMPSFAPGRIRAVRTDSAIQIDGILDEAAWQLTADPDGSVAHIAGLRGLWSPGGVILGFESDALSSGLRLDITLQAGMASAAVPPATFVVTMDSDGTIGGQRRVGALELPWDCDWEMATTTEEGHWRAEIRIPWDGLSAQAKPVAGDRWRINASLRNEADGTLVAQWGYEHTDAIAHGAILTFGGDDE